MAVQSLQERLEAAGDPAAQHRAVDLDVADPRGPEDPVGWRGTDATHRHLVVLALSGHTFSVGIGRPPWYPWNPPTGTYPGPSTGSAEVVGCAPWPGQPGRPGNLPAEATSFVGRRRELAEVRALLSAARVVSVVGPGGVGKTRLAVRAAAGLARGFPDGVWLVSLAEVRDPALVDTAAAVALTLQHRAPDGTRALLRSYLADKQLLLVLDNCEHVVDATAMPASSVVEPPPGSGPRHQPRTAGGVRRARAATADVGRATGRHRGAPEPPGPE